VWQEQRRKTLQDRAAKELEDKNGLAATAKEELSNFYAEREKKITAAKEQNRVTEKELKGEMSSVFASGTIWEQVAKMVNLQTTDKGGPDRMRSLLIQLKNQK